MVAVGVQLAGRTERAKHVLSVNQDASRAGVMNYHPCRFSDLLSFLSVVIYPVPHTFSTINICRLDCEILYE